MKKFPFLSLTLLVVLSILLSACKLPASIDETAPSDPPVSFPRTPAVEEQPSVAYPVPEQPVVPPAVEARPADPTSTALPPTPAAVTATPESTVSPTQIPTQPPSPEATAPAATPLPVSGTRIQFQTGGTSANVQGELPAGQSTTYILQASAGQTMNVQVWSPNADVHLAIAGLSDGKNLLEASEKANRWTGNLPATQDYSLTLNATGGLTSYSVEVVIPPAGTSQPAATAAAPSSTPTASASGTRLDPNAAFGKPKFTDNMDSSSRTNWVNAQGEWPNTDNIRIAVENQRFYVTGKQPGFMTWWFTWPSPKDFYLEMTVQNGDCTGKDAYGVILRGPQHRAGKSYGYIVAFSCDGAYQVFRVDGANPFSSTTLVDWTRSDHILTGANQRNVLGVKAEGNAWTIYANGYKIGETQDGTYLEGRIGVYVAPATTRNYTYRVEKLTYWNLAD